MSLADVAEIVGGTLTGISDASEHVTAPVVFEFRKIVPGGLFAAMAGSGDPRVAEALAAGAVAVLASRPSNGPTVVVPNVHDALIALAADLAGQAIDTTIVGIAGSTGKTSVKDLLAQLLPHVGATVASEVDRDNDISFAQTVLGVDEKTRVLLLKMRAARIGQVRRLANMAQPDIGLVLAGRAPRVGGASQLVAAAQRELVEALPPGGLAVMNADDPSVRNMAQHGRARTVLYGLSASADVRAYDVRIDSRGRPHFVLRLPEGVARVAMQLVGKHHVVNALAAAAVARACGLAVTEIADGLREVIIRTPGRMQVLCRPDGIKVINDAYSADPDSTRAALTAMAGIATAQRTIAVLGPMPDFIDQSPDPQGALGNLLAAASIDLVIVVGGHDVRWIAQAASAAGVLNVRVDNRASAQDLLQQTLGTGDCVLVKGASRAGLQDLALALADPRGLDTTAVSA